MIFISFIAFNKSLCHVVIPLLLLSCGCESQFYILYFFLEFFIHLNVHNNNDRNKTVLLYAKFKSQIKQKKFAMNANRFFTMLQDAVYMLNCTFEPLINMLMHFTLIRYPSNYCHAKIEEIYQKYFHYSLKLFWGL